ncbi:MAG: NUDIX hydrolase [Candidatus Gracilibacteria bacterium]
MIEDEAQHFVGKIAQKAIIEYQDKFLVCRPTKDSLWEFPGGRLNNEGTPYENLEREVTEELSICIKNIRALHVIFSLHVKSNTKRILIGYHAYADTDICILDKDEVEEIRWISKEELKAIALFDDCREIADYFLETELKIK